MREEKKRIIMVDDEPDLVAIADSWLTPCYDFVGVFNGDGLIDLMERYNPDLIILDVNMPGANGFGLCRGIRAIPHFSTVPILFLTGCVDDEDFVKGWEAGGSSYLTKPICRSELLSLVGKLLSKSNNESSDADERRKNSTVV